MMDEWIDRWKKGCVERQYRNMLVQGLKEVLGNLTITYLLCMIQQNVNLFFLYLAVKLK